MTLAPAVQGPVLRKKVIALRGRRSDDLRRILEILQADPARGDRFCAALPFSLNDTTAGVENELQTVVVGAASDIDLPITITASNYYKNVRRRHRTGDAPRQSVTALDRYLADNPESVWENSWVRFPKDRLCPYAQEVFARDILSDKSSCNGPNRSDADRFTVTEAGTELLRVPVSYLLKISLADAVGRRDTPERVRRIGLRLLDHFSNDNTSPETVSFYPVPMRPERQMGREIARETLKRFLLCQFLTAYANTRFGLRDRGQQAMVYFAPHPPIRQKRLNDLISDAFYRELFMSPCLSGWDRGEEKHRYMALCHQVLSRSQLNAVAKLKEAGIIVNNLVVLPRTSNISLANNGTHLSLGSRKLTRLLQQPGTDFTPSDEKHMGDLVIKVVEHFLPLFVGTYSGAPYRLDFEELHPERALGFLPHELDFTHLRMFWRRWKKKAAIRVLGKTVTPFGPEWLDRWIRSLFRLKGDMVPDFRLIDYLVALMSTDQSPALDGRLDNDRRLKQDLADLGIFDASMSLYLLYRLRQCATIGFSGFEGRHYSLFETLLSDMGQAADLQILITALAWKYILQGDVRHDTIPDDPFLESERRQVFFGSAVGIPTFFVHRDTRNRFMRRLLRATEGTRHSRRYRGYIRVPNAGFRRALIRRLRQDGADLIEMLGLEETLRELAHRIDTPAATAAGKLTAGILDDAGARCPMALSGAEFNKSAEHYYRHRLRRHHIREAMDQLRIDVADLDGWDMWRRGTYNREMLQILGGRNAVAFIDSCAADVANDTASPSVLRKLIFLMLLTLHRDMAAARSGDAR